jgi:hypothetical protein
MSTPRKTVVSAVNATLRNEDGSTHTDLFAANGTLLLGHSNPAIVSALAEQAHNVWITGRLDTDTRLAAYRLVEQRLPERSRVAGFYSTGMEAAESATTPRGGGLMKAPRGGHEAQPVPECDHCRPVHGPSHRHHSARNRCPASFGAE